MKIKRKGQRSKGEGFSPWTLMLTLIAAFVATASLSAGGVLAHPLRWESDDNNNSTITYCFAKNVPNGHKPYFNRAAGATDGWERFNASLGPAAPDFALADRKAHSRCEVRVLAGTPTKGGVAEVQPNLTGQDLLVYDTAFFQNTNKLWRQHLLSHEFGHTLGLDEAGKRTSCSASVMRVGCTLTNASAYPTEKHDRQDIERLWVNQETRIFPD
jgi:hypothetical protein